MPKPTPAAVSLCLACSASLPPRKDDTKVHYTQCCSRPICPHCVSTNPRLARYNPCLRCLAGVNAVSAKSPPGSSSAIRGAGIPNVDGAVRDEDIFVVDDEDSESDTDSEQFGPAIGENTANKTPNVSTSPLPPSTDDVQRAANGSSGIPKYFIRPEDTLLGICLKLGIDGRVLCRLNNLPVSTLRTTPHLLHTRSFIILPPTASSPPPLSPAEQAADEERRAKLARERAETRFQALTKETDRDVAKAYVALADIPDGKERDFKEYEDAGLRKRRVRSVDDVGEGSLEGRATDHYFDDEEWEARERADGRRAALPPFPYAGGAGPSRLTGQAAAEAEKSWWRWKS
ncbi:hypothetical protein C8Q77DRAFT_1155458 [Trametes polyzona]|nr:hypothetical protein C8Q77DRAFT_1155458 [Trametes polyzona]